MTTPLPIELTCPVCCRTFDSKMVLPARTAGRKRTDFHEPGTSVQTLPYLVHSCAHCGYTGDDGDFGGDAHIHPMTASHVWHELTPKVVAGPISASDKYEFAAKVAEWQRAESLEVADLLLRAAWCCVDEDDIEAERFFRRKAAWKFEAALATWGVVNDGDRAVLAYLVGELWRRVGDVKTATKWFDRVPSEIVAPLRQRWILNAAMRQRDDPREWFE